MQVQKWIQWNLLLGIEYEGIGSLLFRRKRSKKYQLCDPSSLLEFQIERNGRTPALFFCIGLVWIMYSWNIFFYRSLLKGLFFFFYCEYYYVPCEERCLSHDQRMQNFDGSRRNRTSLFVKRSIKFILRIKWGDQSGDLFNNHRQIMTLQSTHLFVFFPFLQRHSPEWTKWPSVNPIGADDTICRRQH